MSAMLSLTRESVALELRRGEFEILVDDKNVGSIKHAETVQTAVEPGRHMLRIRKGRYSSHGHSFDAVDGETVSFRCTGAILWPRYVISLIKPDLGIALKQR